jgi:hypothetical protein
MRNYLSTTALALSLSAGALVSLSANSASVVLDFSGNICGAAGNQACTNFAQIGQNYGDTTGLNVSHRSTDLAGATYEPFLKYWANNYSGLNDIAWGGAGETGQRSEFTFAALSGYTVTLDTVTFGSYLNAERRSSYTVRDLGTNALLFSSGGTFLVDANPDTFNPGVSSTSGLVLTWGPDGYNVGVDEIRLTVAPTVTTAVPEPETYAMMLAGLGLLGFAARRRKQKSAA